MPKIAYQYISWTKEKLRLLFLIGVVRLAQVCLTLYQAGFFKLLKGRRFFDLCQKNCYKSCSNKSLETWYNTSLDFNKNLTLVTWSKWWRQHCFWSCNYSKTIFLSFKFFFCLKSTVLFFGKLFCKMIRNKS